MCHRVLWRTLACSIHCQGAVFEQELRALHKSRLLGSTPKGAGGVDTRRLHVACSFQEYTGSALSFSKKHVLFFFPWLILLMFPFFSSFVLFVFLLKSTLVVNNDTTVYGVHTDTVAVSPTVLVKCSICSYPHVVTCTPSEWLKKTIHDKVS